ncbi:MAG: IS200/IS605 family accessory protein TnpB-related protein [Methanobacterium sp.]
MQLVFQPMGLPSSWKDVELNLLTVGGIKKKLKYNPSMINKELKKAENYVIFLEKRKNVINEYMNKNVQYIIQYCLKNKIGNIIIGELKNIKQNINIGRKNNQNFVNIPHNLFKQKIKSKCELYGIEYIETSESYTSQKCSQCRIIDKTNRKHRGLYTCKN